MIIRRIPPLANDNLEGEGGCKWSSRGSGHLQMIIWMIRPLANDHPEDPGSCKWSSGGSGHLQMIIWRDRTLANDHQEDPASCKLSSGGSSHLQMIIWRIRPLANDHPSPPSPQSPLPGSNFNLADLSRTICVGHWPDIAKPGAVSLFVCAINLNQATHNSKHCLRHSWRQH